MISREISEMAQPKIIVVTNTMTKDFLRINKNIEKNQGIWMNYDFFLMIKLVHIESQVIKSSRQF